MEHHYEDLNTDHASLYNKVLNSCHSSGITNFSTPKTSFLPPNSNPTLSIKKRVLYNPFNVNLKERLENHTCSPTVFSIVVSPNQNSDEFKWTIDDMARINPVPIEEEFIYEDNLDEETEKEIQKTIETYFKEKHLIPSPMSVQYQSSLVNCEAQFGNSTENDAINVSLALPAYLSKDFEQMSYEEHENICLPNLPRKLIFNADEEQLSPVKFHDTEQFWSPEIGGSLISRPKNACYPSTPVLHCRTICTPPPSNLSPINISPINRVNDKSSAVGFQSDISVMQTDTSFSGLEIFNKEADEKVNIGVECSKITMDDSPKSICCSRPHKRLKLDRMSKLVSSVSDKMDADTSMVLSQDTGYYTDQNTKSHTSFRYSCSSSKMWDEENKENYHPTAYTPMKKKSYKEVATSSACSLRF